MKCTQEKQRTQMNTLLAAVGTIVLLGMLACSIGRPTQTPENPAITLPPPDTPIPSTVPPTETPVTRTATPAPVPDAQLRRMLPMVWVGLGDTPQLPELDDDRWHGLPDGSRVKTDERGEGCVRLKDCMDVYVFRVTELKKSACPKSNLTSGNVFCAAEGTAAFNNRCGSQITIETDSARIELHGTWVAVSYLPGGWDLSVIQVLEGSATVQPVRDTETYTLGDVVHVNTGQALFTVPDDKLDLWGDLPMRTPVDELHPRIAELIEAWQALVLAQAERDGVYHPTPTPTITPTFTPTGTPTSTPTHTPTFTPAPTPTWTPVPTSTFTPIPTPTPYIDFRADPARVDEGGSCTLSWHVEHVQAAYLSGGRFNNQGVAGPDGSESSGPLYTDTTYSLRVVLPDGSEETRTARVTVITPTPTDSITDSSPDLPDLVVITFKGSGPVEYVSGRYEVPVRAIIRNQGGLKADIFKVATEYTGSSGTFVAPFTVEGQTSVWYPYTSAPLVPGGDVTFVGKVILPDSLAGQAFSLNAIADSCSGDEFMPDYCRVPESNEGNNVSYPIVLQLPYYVE